MIKRNNKGQFINGNSSGKRFTSEFSRGNQFAKGNDPNKTSFKVGQTAGSKSNTWKGGIQRHKNDGYYIYLGVGKRMRLSRYNWIRENGDIPQGYVIYHIDGDRFNDDISNLELITRAELAIRNKNSTPHL